MIRRVTAVTNLHSFIKRPYGKLSGGEKRRTDIARSLIHTPSILILDEPTTGLDAGSRKSIWNTILQLQKETKMTVFLTTHYIEDATNSDYVVVMKAGEIVAKGTPEQLKDDYASDYLIITAKDVVKMRNMLSAEKLEFNIEKSFFYLPLKKTTDAIPILSKFSDLLLSFEVRKSSLDDVFIAINGKDVSNDDGIH